MTLLVLIWMWLPIIIIGGLLYLIWRALEKRRGK